jgi:hypothetical protein
VGFCGRQPGRLKSRRVISAGCVAASDATFFSKLMSTVGTDEVFRTATDLLSLSAASLDDTQVVCIRAAIAPVLAAAEEGACEVVFVILIVDTVLQ